MNKGRIELAASTAFGSAAQTAERRTATGLLIQVQADCIGHARNLASDLETAAELGAGPLIREVMIERVDQADRDHRPLACAVFYPA